MLKDYIFWGLFIAVVAGVIASLLKRRRRGPDPRGPTHSNRMQFHAHTDADAHDSGTPRLVCIGGSHDGHTLAIPPGGLSIGRARDNLLIIVDGRISSHHAWIGMVDGRVMLRDYQSLNGTFLNADLKTRVGDAVLADGDIVHFGGVVGEEFPPGRRVIRGGRAADVSRSCRQVKLSNCTRSGAMPNFRALDTTAPISAAGPQT
jgi:hypothetical protein